MQASFSLPPISFSKSGEFIFSGDPFQRVRQGPRGEFDMKDAPVPRFGCWSRAMQKQRLHDYCSAARDEARRNRTFGPPGCNVLRGQSPIAVRSRDDLQRAVINAAVVQVKADREHLVQNRWRSLNM